MYARYIPPPKADYRNDAEPPRVPAEVTDSLSNSTATQSTTPYARYVPPPKPKHTEAPTPALTAKRIVFDYEEQADESSSKKRKLEPSDQNAIEPGKKKSKKSKESRRGAESEILEKDLFSQNLTDNDVVGVVENSQQESSTIVKSERDYEKKSKKSKKLSMSSPEPANLGTKPKTSKKEKKATEQKASNKLSPEPETPPTEPVSNPSDDDQEPPKAKTKTKKKRSSDATVEIPGILNNESVDDTTERHKSVLKKKEKSLKRLKREAREDNDTKESKEQAVANADGVAEEPPEIHGLEPLPQPEPVAQDNTKAAYETLPAWLAAPIRVTPTKTTTFTKLGIDAEVEKALAAKGYKEAFAVQTAAIPMLMPSADRQGDLVVSAATGSGKTLAYVLPMVRDISQGVVTKLRGLIVVPTRELVRQAQEVCEICSAALSGPGRKRVRIGISMGNQAFKTEQIALMGEEQHYDPEGYQSYLRKRHDPDAFEYFGSDPHLNMFQETMKPLPDHVVDYVSKVDILICTPGRLVEHINLTPGFNLDYVRWLVVDEADKLLAQSFQQWLGVVMEKLSVEKYGARDFLDSNKSGVRKIILSATMTRDLSLLNGLKLRRPRLIVLEGTRSDEDDDNEDKTVHVLPELLRETGIKVRDPDQKPLLLVDLLQSAQLKPINVALDKIHDDAEEDPDNSDDTSSSGSDSEDTSDPDSDSDDESNENSDDDSLSAGYPTKSRKTFQSTVLVFTKSNETALRLSRLLSILAPSLAPLVGTLTSTTRTSQRRKTLQAFASRKFRILIASDLVARGIDLTNLDHVVNYDMPTSVASYVHRVGRTARAGRSGHAWTFFTKTEAGWFWPEIAGQGKNPSKLGGIKRTQKVENIRFGGDEGRRFSEKGVETYEAALEKLGQEAGELRRRR